MRASGRGEAKGAWASERRFDPGEGPVSGKKFPCCSSSSSSGRLCAGLSGCPVVRLSGGFRFKTFFVQHVSRTTRGQPSKTTAFSMIFTDNVVKPKCFQLFCGQPSKTTAFSTFSADNLVKPMLLQQFSRTT